MKNVHVKDREQKDSDRQKYGLERKDEFLLDALEEYSESREHEIPEIIFVDDEAIIINDSSAEYRC